MRHFRFNGAAAITVLLVALVLLLNAMAACPALHELIHHDADAPDHECGVTMFAHGQVDGVSAEVPAPAQVTFIESLPVVEFSVFSPAIKNLPDGRGPPVVVSSPA
jgi:xanthine/uracil permease